MSPSRCAGDHGTGQGEAFTPPSVRIDRFQSFHKGVELLGLIGANFYRRTRAVDLPAGTRNLPTEIWAQQLRPMQRATSGHPSTL